MSQLTRTAIINSFKKILNKKALDRITVKMICEDCGINRQTFYYYYEDIIDLFKTTMREELKEALGENRTLDKWKEGFVATMKYLGENSKMVLNVYNSPYWPEAEGFFVRIGNKLLLEVMDATCEGLNITVSDEDKDFIVTFYRLMFMGFMLRWIRDGMKEKPEKIMENIEKMTSGSVSTSLITFAENNLENNHDSNLKSNPENIEIKDS